jgi:Outer membrane protein beta-barrel domain
MWKRFAYLFLVAACFVPLAAAQDEEHVQVGVFADYLRLSQTDNNFGGVGAQVSFQAYKEFKMEGSMAYDFNQTFTEGFTDGSGTFTTARTGLRVLHGEFGPRVNIGHHAIQPFVTLKGGFIDFRVDNAPATLGTFFSSVGGLRANNVNGVLYPGGGLQGHLGPVGLRLDIGDEMYFNHGTHNNLRVAFGPVFRF